MGNYFYTIYRYFTRHPFVFGISMLLLFGVLLATATRISFEEDISRLIPKNTANQNLQKVMETANFSDKIIINIQKKDKGDTQDLTEYAAVLVDSLEENHSEYIQKIQGNVGEDGALETLDFVYEHLPLFLTDEEYAMLEQKLNKDSIAAITKANYNALISPSGLLAKQVLVKDPLGLSVIGLKQLQKLGYNEDFKLIDGFLVSKDEQNLLLFITPTFPTYETDKNEPFVERLYGLQDQLNDSYKMRVTSEAFGGALVAVANAQQIKNDIQFTLSIALSVLLVVFILFYRKLTIPFILFVPTLFGGLASVAFLYLVRGEISAISLGIGSVLLGVTLDYSLHILTHIRNNESVAHLFASVAKPILMSSLTTALAFLCLLFIDSRALQDLGLFAAVSVLSAAVFALVLIPQLYRGTSTVIKRTILDRFAAYPFQKNSLLIGLLGIVVVLSCFTYNSVGFNNNLSQLNYKTKALQEAETRLDSLTNTMSKSLYVIAFGTEMQEVLAENDSVFAKLQQLKDKGDILQFNSVASLANAKATQLKKIKDWSAFWTPSKINQVRDDLIESGNDYGFKTTTHKAFYELLEKDFYPLSISQFKALEALPVADFISEKEDFVTVSSLVKVDANQTEQIKSFFAERANVLVIDRQAINESLLGNLKNEFNQLIFYCFGVVVMLLLLFYRNLKITLVTILPILLTWFVTVGLMGLFGLEFTIFNVIISSFIFGLGVDYSIFITNGLLHESKIDAVTLITYKTSIVLSVLTTILGVGVLIFAKHPALYSISVVTIIGIVSAMLIAFVVQPLLFNLLIFKKKNNNQ